MLPVRIRVRGQGWIGLLPVRVGVEAGVRVRRRLLSCIMRQEQPSPLMGDPVQDLFSTFIAACPQQTTHRQEACRECPAQAALTSFPWRP